VWAEFKLMVTEFWQIITHIWPMAVVWTKVWIEFLLYVTKFLSNGSYVLAECDWSLPEDMGKIGNIG
jgi:hypothetical protein